MPNWCSNNLYVTGDLTRFNEWLDHAFLFDKIVPMPDELKDSEPFNEKHPKRDEFKKKYGAYDWYDWRVQNWGTKWDVDEANIEQHGDEFATIVFSTAWSPPQVAIGALAAKFPELKFKLAFIEEGNGFVGYDIWRDGEYQGGESFDDCSTDEWKKLATEEFGWEEHEEESQ
jgi:hypothetical protein